jgi:hypothetical protein
LIHIKKPVLKRKLGFTWLPLLLHGRGSCKLREARPQKSEKVKTVAFAAELPHSSPKGVFYPLSAVTFRGKTLCAA